MILKETAEGEYYIITDVATGDRALDGFLFSLGCRLGEKVFLVSHLKSNLIIKIKNGRYSIDIPLANAIKVEKPQKEQMKKSSVKGGKAV